MQGENRQSVMGIGGEICVGEIDVEKITAVMVTGKDAEHESFARLSVKSFLDQTHSNKKLLIINDGEYSLSDLNCDEVEEIRVDNSDKKLRLGGLRNYAFNYLSKTDIWTQWDDDDYRHPRQLEELYTFMVQGDYDVSYLGSFTWYFWNINHATVTRNIGQTIGSAMFRGIHAEYSNEEKAEDYEYIFDKLKEELKLNIGIVDSHPSRYLYFIHGGNTWDERHFMGKRTRIFSRDNKDVWDVDEETEKYLKQILLLYGINGDMK